MSDDNQILELVPSEYKAIAKEQLTHFINFHQNEDFVLSNQALAEEIIRFCESNPNITKERQVWSKTSNLKVYSYHLEPNMKNIEDQIYSTNPKIQKYLPKGLLIIDGKIALFGMSKFYGLQKGDDDNPNHLTEEFKSSMETFIVTNKVNGCLAQISWYENDDYMGWIIGCNNYYIFCTSPDDLIFYTQKSEFKNTILVATEWFKILNSYSPYQQLTFQEFLIKSQLTLNFELEHLQNQNIVPVQEICLNLITITGLNHPMGINPSLVYAIAKKMAIPCVIKTLLRFNKNMLATMIESTRTSWKSEGSVFLVLDRNLEIIQRIKIKSWWYILILEIQKSINDNLDSFSADKCGEKISEKILDMQKKLQIDHDYIMQFEILGRLFSNWVFDQFDQEDTSDDEFLGDYLFTFPILWETFLEEHKLTKEKHILSYDLEPLINTKLQKSDQDNDLKIIHQKPNNDQKSISEKKQSTLLVLFQGIPGLGKSYLAQKIKKELKVGHAIESEVVTQEEFFYLGHKESNQACLDHVKKLVDSGKYHVVLLARNNSNINQYHLYMKFPNVILFAPHEYINRKPEMVALSIGSVLERKKQNSLHPLDNLTKSELASLCFKFFSKFEIDQKAHYIDYLEPTFLMDEQDRNWLNIEIKRFEKSEKPFAEEDVSDLFLTSIDFLQVRKSRRSIDYMVNECIEHIRKGVLKSINQSKNNNIDSKDKTNTNVNTNINTTSNANANANTDSKSQKENGDYLAVDIDIQSNPRTILNWKNFSDLLQGRQCGPMEVILTTDQNHQNWNKIKTKLGQTISIAVIRYKQFNDQIAVAEVLFDKTLSYIIADQEPCYLIIKYDPDYHIREYIIDFMKDQNINWINLTTSFEFTGKISYHLIDN